jgi:chemotaxis protein MotB
MSDVKPELVIIRRRGAFEDAPIKGGVWKIAHADFMTAMMAFFLVMWLLNALNQSQRKDIANYFNPIKLAETTVAPKGLKDLQEPKDEVTNEPSSEGQENRRKPVGPNQERRGNSPTVEKPPFSEEKEKILFRDPYAALSEIASGSGAEAGQRRAGALASAEEEGLKGGDAYRDPFDPGYWKLAPQAANDPAPARESEPSAPPAAPADTTPPLPPGPAPASPARGGAQANLQPNTQPTPAKDTEPQQPTDKQLQSAIVDALSDIKSGAGPAVEVRQVEEGLLVSLTDDAGFGMFAIGSAEPRAELIRVIDKIGPLVSKRQGAIIVRGHTDNRPYRSDTYDNWRLSTARAQMAYYMLVRAGVDPQRIEHVEGYADRRPKLPNDPAAAPNRRIEILIREKRP